MNNCYHRWTRNYWLLLIIAAIDMLASKKLSALGELWRISNACKRPWPKFRLAHQSGSLSHAPVSALSSFTTAPHPVSNTHSRSTSTPAPAANLRGRLSIR